MVAIALRARGRLAASPLLAPLAAPGFRLYWTGNAVSQAGDQFQIVALAILALDLTGSAAVLGAVLTAQAIPRTLLMLVGGVAIDRLRPRTVLLASSALQTLVVTLLAGLAASGQLALWHLYVYGVLAGACLAFSIPAGQAMVTDLLPRDEVRGGTALINTTFNLTMFLAPPLAGIAVAAIGPVPAFTFNAASFAVAFACLVFVEARDLPPKPPGESALAQLREGFAVTWRDSALLVAVLCGTIYSLGFQGVALVGVPALAKLALDGGSGGVGVLFGARGAGALLGLVAGGALRTGGIGLFAGLTLTATGVALASVGLAPTLVVAAALLFVASAAQANAAVSFITIVQTRAPAAVRGRVTALFMLGVMGLAPLSLSFGGLMADALGPRGVFLTGGALVAASGCFALANRTFRAAA